MEPLGKEHNQAVLRAMHDQGVEMTPDELMATRKSAYAKIRAGLRRRGVACPDEDRAFIVWLKVVMGK
jgi:hypothetical protein